VHPVHPVRNRLLDPQDPGQESLPRALRGGSARERPCPRAPVRAAPPGRPQGQACLAPVRLLARDPRDPRPQAPGRPSDRRRGLLRIFVLPFREPTVPVRSREGLERQRKRPGA
jgi:hypothetical protein